VRTYVGDRDGGIPMVFVVEDTRPDLGEVVDLLGDLYRLPDEMSLPEAGTAGRWAHVMAKKEALLARIQGSERIRAVPLPLPDRLSGHGLSWGHQGEEALAVAHSILSHELRAEPPEGLARHFMEEVIAELPYERFRLSAAGIQSWLCISADQLTIEEADPFATERSARSHPALAVADPGLEAPGGAPADEPTASALVAACEEAWAAIQDHHPELPAAVVVLGSGVERGRLVKLGHWWSGRWVADGKVRGEVLLAGEALHLPPAAVFEVLLHEAAHGLSAARGVKDTSRGGRYHNARFRDAAEEVGLLVEPMPPYGLARTTLSPVGQERYAGAVARLGDAMRIARQVEALSVAGAGQGQGAEGAGAEPGRSRSRTSALAQCGCGRKLRMAPTVLAAGPVLCGLCGAEFAGGPRPTQEQSHEADAVVDHTFLARRQSALVAETEDAGRLGRAIAGLEHQWTTLESALAVAGIGSSVSTLDPLRQRLELVRVLVEEFRDQARLPSEGLESEPTAVQEEGVRELLDAPTVPDGELTRWYQQFGTAEEQPMGGATEAERERRGRLARALLKADGTLTGPAVHLSGQEFMAGDRVVVAEDDPPAGVPGGVLGTVERVHPDEPAISVDFATLGRLKISLADSLAGRLRHDYVSHDPAAEGSGGEPTRDSLALEAQRSAPEVEV
jgi:hypothetical protein